MRMKWTRHILSMSDNKTVKGLGTKQQAITTKAKEALDSLWKKIYVEQES